MPYACNPENIINLDLGWAGLGWDATPKNFYQRTPKHFGKKKFGCQLMRIFSSHKLAAVISVTRATC